MNLRRLSYIKPKLIRGENFIWRTKDNKQIHLYEMTNSHIINCIQFLTKKNIILEKQSIGRPIGDVILIKEHQNMCENHILLFEYEMRYREQENIRI
jgi:hypothetical protein